MLCFVLVYNKKEVRQGPALLVLPALLPPFSLEPLQCRHPLRFPCVIARFPDAGLLTRSRLEDLQEVCSL